MIKMRKTKAMLVLATLIIMLSIAAHASAASVDPVYFGEWQSGDAEDECEQAGCDADYYYKVDNPANNGDYETPEGNTITIKNSDTYTFDFESEHPVKCVIVSRGNIANVYYYPDGVNSDTELTGPGEYQISHVTFCFEGPEFVIPEAPIGTISTLLAMLGAAALLRSKIPSIK